MSDEAGTGREVATCDMSISADEAHVSLYLGSAEPDKSFEFTMPQVRRPCHRLLSPWSFMVDRLER